MSQNINTLDEDRTFWTKFKEIEVGPVSLPVFIIFAALILLVMYTGNVPINVLGGMGVIMVFGWALGKIGSSIPVLKKFGGATILAMIVPAILVLFSLIPQNSIDAVTMLMSEANFLDLYVFSLITGSILGMNRTILVQGFIRMVVPMMTGFVLALLIPSTIGWALGLGFMDTLFYIVTPVMAGGIGGGILPLGIGYSAITGINYGDLIAILAPATIIANIFAIVGAAIFNQIGKRKPELSGNGTLIKSGDKIELNEDEKETKTEITFKLLGTGFFLLITLYLTGVLLEGVIGLPAAVLIIFGSTILKYFEVLPKRVERGTKQLNSLVSSLFTLPLMVGLGIIYLTLEDVLAMLSWQYLVVVFSVVVTLGTTGYVLSRFVKMHPVEATILSLNQSAMGGTGNVAILSTSERQEMMPFAQVATRIGGAITISLMITLMRILIG